MAELSNAVPIPMRARALAAAWGHRLDAWLFQRQRADYYEYLADLIECLHGRKTLRDLFLDDAARYGNRSARGRLAQRWAHAYEAAGGDLALAWAGALPADECLLVATAQDVGAGALSDTLRDLAHAARLIEQARSILFSTLAAGLVALVVAACMVSAVPLFTVPRLQQVFQAVPPEYYGRQTQNLFGLAEFLRNWVAFLLAGLAGGGWLTLWSLPNLTGRLRNRLDCLFPWRLYRDFHAIRFLAMLAVLMRQRNSVDTRLRHALAAHAWGCAPWLAAHIDAMVARIDGGLVGAQTFDTGLLDRETWWFLSDMIGAHGMEAGMQRARERIEARSLTRISRQALAMRWALLLASVSAVLALALWHYGVVDEMRRALTSFYASH